MDGQILKFVNDFSYFWKPSLVNWLKGEKTVSFISEICISCRKTPSESVLLLLAAVRYLNCQDFLSGFSKLKGGLSEFIDLNRSEIIDICLKKNIQANYPERAMPIMETIGRIVKSGNILVIELGASSGLIGNCLINFDAAVTENRYFSEGQQYPEFSTKISNYIGIEICPPENEWMLACISDDNDRRRISDFIQRFPAGPEFKIIIGSAFNVNELLEKVNLDGYTIVILTSFMLYQFDSTQRKQLVGEIERFRARHNAFWLNQMVDISAANGDSQYFIEWNGSKIIRLDDDRGNVWRWI